MSDTYVTDSTPADIWADARPTETRGITADDIRDLWARNWAPLGDAEADVLALALDDATTAQAEAAREALTAAYMSHARSIAARHIRFEGDDARQTALMGMWQGFREYTPSKGHRRPVATVQRNIIRALSDASMVRFSLTVPEDDRLKFAKATAAHPEDIATAAEHAPEHGLSTAHFWDIYCALHARSVAPDGTVPTGADDSGSADVFPMVAPAEINPAAVAMVAGLLDLLDAPERRVIALRFGLDGEPVHTEDEAAEVLGRTPRRVRQIQAAALAKLRESTPAK